MNNKLELRRNMFYDIDTGALYYKTLRICNVRKVDRLSSKLVPFLLSVTLADLDTNTLLYESVNL